MMRMVISALAVAASWTTVSMPAAAVANAPVCAGRAATLVGSSGDDMLRGTSGVDVIVAGAGDDTVRGYGGGDRICGGRGSDYLMGGGGADRLYGGLSRLALTDEGTSELTGDRLEGGRGNDLLTPGVDLRRADDVFPDDLDFSRAPARVAVDLQTRRADGTGVGVDTIVLDQALAVTGSAYSDRLYGSRRRDHLIGGPGSDELRGRAGQDRIYLDPPATSGRADDIAQGGPGDDLITGNAGRDLISGGSGDDVLEDLGLGADGFWGGAGNDHVIDQVAQTPMPDIAVYGGRGRDRLTASTSRLNPSASPSRGSLDLTSERLEWDLLDESHGWVQGRVASVEVFDPMTYGTTWVVLGTPRSEQVIAGATTRTVFWGRSGDDVFSGSAGDDFFAGSSGTDRVQYMGEGHDSCRSVEVFDLPPSSQDCESIVP